MSQELSQSHTFHPSILREYDIRGVVGDTLTPKDALALGRAFGTFVSRRGGNHICVGYDGRNSSPEMAKQLMCGLMETGLFVELIGLGPSPMLYYAVKSRKADAGIMVTGSHNPAGYNGFKMMLQKEAVYGALIQKLGDIARNGDYELITEANKGESETIDIKADYIERILRDLTNKRPLKIVWDAGNGAAGEVLRMLTRRLPGQHILLYDTIDGKFPNHHPDPTVDENLVDLQRTVLKNKCDLGIAFDGDGDRIGVVDENGQIIRCDTLLALYAADVLRKNKGAHIIGDVKCSSILFNEIERLGGHPVMWKTGHSLVKAKMAELNAPLAGELSGHIFFADKYYGYDDALYCAVRLINLLGTAQEKDKKATLSSLIAHLPASFNTPEIRIEVDENRKFKLVEQIKKSLENQQDIKLSVIDGVRVTTPEGWWLVRASNTQNVLVARVESTTKEGLENLKQHLTEEIKKTGHSLAF